MQRNQKWPDLWKKQRSNNLSCGENENNERCEMQKTTNKYSKMQKKTVAKTVNRKRKQGVVS